MKPDSAVVSDLMEKRGTEPRMSLGFCQLWGNIVGTVGVTLSDVGSALPTQQWILLWEKN